MRIGGVKIGKNSPVLVLLCTSASYVVSSNSRNSIRSANIDNLLRSGIVPDLINKKPSHPVVVDYDGIFALQGNELTMSHTKSTPRVYYPNAKRGKLYTIFMLDPDAPSRMYPFLSPFLHYMVINAPQADNLEGETLVSYLSPTPPPTTDRHRYVFLVYEQKGWINPSPMLPLISRIRFTLDNFPEGSELVGPVAANFFVSQFSI